MWDRSHLHGFRDFRQLRYHIQNFCPTTNHIIVLSHEQVIGAYMKVAGHSDEQIDGWIPLTALHFAEMFQTDVQRFGYFLLRHAPGLAESA